MGSIFLFPLCFFAFLLTVCLVLVEVSRIQKQIEKIMINADSSEKNITTSIGDKMSERENL